MEVVVITAIISSIGLKGIEGYKIQVEVQLIPGIESVNIVGLPDVSVKESKDRVMGALYAYECEIPDKKVIINLSPAEQRKNSSLFDLAMAIGVMKADGFIEDAIPEKAAFLGGLSLDGSVTSIEGMLPAILAAKKEGFQILYLPYLEDVPLTQIDGIELRFVRTIEEVIDSFSGQLSVFDHPAPISTPEPTPLTNTHEKDFKHIFGHQQAKRA